MHAYFWLPLVWLTWLSSISLADDWPRFRGPAGSGVASDSDSLPNTWSPSTNLAWKIALPGPGASSPIIIGDRVFVTCYSGYGLDLKNPGQIENLVRHLVCIDLESGQTLWQKNIKAALPEDPYDKSGVSSHGYASHTPVSDGSQVFCFFGKSGVYAFDFAGHERWHAEAGKGSDPPRWGSASSPIVHRDTVIVTASAESQSVLGFDTTTGKKRWQYQSSGLDGMWGTPTIVPLDQDRADLVLLVAGELWGLDPASGKLRWNTKVTDSQQAYTSVVTQGERVFAFSGQGGVCIAIKPGNRGQLSDAQTSWTSNVAATYASPVRYRDKLYLVSRGILTVVDARTGKRLQSTRLKGSRNRGTVRFGALDYASPVVVGDRLFWLNASGQMFVFGMGEEVRQLAVNEVTTDNENFWGSPAISAGRMVLRSSKHLYCIAKSGTGSSGFFSQEN